MTNGSIHDFANARAGAQTAERRDAAKPLLEARGLCKSYGGALALAPTTFSLARGEFLAIIGPSGCGKTTLLSLVAGLLAPDAGAILYDGVDITHRPAEARGIPMIFQDHLLFPHLRVLDNVAFGLRMRGVPRAAREATAAAMLAKLRIGPLARRFPAELSGGQKQRVAIARALVLNPGLLLMDEPFSNLDSHLREDIRDVVLALREELNVAMVMVTHDHGDAMAMADRLAVMGNGRVLQLDAPEAVYHAPRNREVAKLLGHVNVVGGTCARGVFTPDAAPEAAWPLPGKDRDRQGRACAVIPPQAVRCAAPDAHAPKLAAEWGGRRFAGQHAWVLARTPVGTWRVPAGTWPGTPSPRASLHWDAEAMIVMDEGDAS